MISRRVKPPTTIAGDEEALPEVEGGAALGGRALVGAERRELAAGQQQGAQGDHHGGQPTAGTLGAASWAFGCVRRGAGQRRVHGADTIEPRKKIGNPRPGFSALGRVSAGGGAGRGRLVGGPGEDAPRHGRGGPGGPGGEDLLARPLDALVPGRGQPGLLGQVAGQAQRPFGRPGRRLGRRGGVGQELERAVGQDAGPAGQRRPARRPGRARGPASAWPGCRPTTRRTGARRCGR